MIKGATKKQIKPGYKKTPVGIIPEDWEVKKFEDLAKRSSKRFDPISGVSKKDLELDSFEQGTGRILNIYDSRDYKSSKNIFEKDDVLFGKLRPYLRKYWKATFDGVCSSEIWVFQNKKPILADYLYLTLQTKYFIDKSQITSGTKMPRAEWSSVKNAKLPVPPKQEQKSIANCLSTWDSGIEKLTQLIQAKKQQKEGLMQQLLTGKKRLEGFEGEWKEVRLGKIVSIIKGEQLNRKKLTETGLYPSYSGGISPSGYTNKSNWKANTITISEGGNSCGYVNYIPVDFWLGGHCYAIEPETKVDKIYLYNLLKINEPKIMILRVGSGLPNVQKGDLSKFKFETPPLKEQNAIANILQTADKEIELLEQKLSSFQEQKKGLMQVLLAGEKRLV